MERSVLLFFLGCVTAIVALVILAIQPEDIFENPKTFILGIAGVIDNVWMLFYTFSIMIVFPIWGIKPLSKRVKPVYLFPATFLFGNAAVVMLVSGIKFAMDVIT